jgi:predicted N-acyltransferase
MRITQASSVDEVDPAALVAITGEQSLFVSPPWLRFVEAHTSFRPRYLLAWDESDQLVGALPAYWSEGGGSQLYDPAALFARAAPGRRKARGEWRPLLLAGTSAGYTNELLLHPRLTPEDRRRAVIALLRAFERVLTETGSRSTAFLYLTHRALTDLRPFLSGSGHVFLTSAAARLDVRWDSFDEYLAWLPKSRRQTVRADLARFSAAGLRWSRGSLSGWADRAGPLLANVQRRYGHQDTPETEVAYLRRQAREVDEHSTLYLAHQGDALVSFSHCITWDRTLYVRSFGIDYKRAGAGSPYFTLCYYLPIQHAIEHGLRAVDFGIGSYEAKVRRGACLHPRWSVVLGPDGHFAPEATLRWNDEQRAALRRESAASPELARTIDAWHPYAG